MDKKIIKFQLLEISRNKIYFGLTMFFPLFFFVLFLIISKFSSNASANEIDLKIAAIAVPLISIITGAGIQLILQPLTEMRIEGTLNQLSLTPIKDKTFFIAHLISRQIIFIPYLIIFLIIGKFLVNYSFLNLLLIALYSIILTVILSLMSYLISNIVSTSNIAGMLGSFSQLFIMFTSLIPFPASIFDNVFINISRIIPWNEFAYLFNSAARNSLTLFQGFLGFAYLSFWTVFLYILLSKRFVILK